MITTEARRTLGGLALVRVEAILVLMHSEGVENPPAALRDLLTRGGAVPEDALAVRYGAMVRALRAVLRFNRNEIHVECAIVRSIGLVASLL